ncbi:hypothetical protein EIP86_004341 [Pleurotus ostreatoroseus]|nr:hypothetical protein EIP86_004341 [Pleurotus ostreatoroseus]
MPSNSEQRPSSATITLEPGTLSEKDDHEKSTSIVDNTSPDLKDETDEPPIPKIPNGGLRAWIVVLAACLFLDGHVHNVWSTSHTIFQVFQTYYETTLLKDESPSTIAWIGSIQYALIFMTGLPAGRLFDKGYLRLPLGIASVSLIVATFLVAQCKVYWEFLLCQGLVIGLASGFIMIPMVNVISQWFTTKSGIAFGYVGMGSSLGGVVFPVVAKRLVSEIGFPWTMRVIGFIQIFLTLIINLGAGRNLPSKKLLPPLSLKPFGIPAFTAYCAGGLTTFLGLYTVLTYVDLSAEAAGLDKNFSFYLVAVANAASTVGRFAGGYFADRIGSLNIIIPSTLVASILTYVWPFSSSVGGFTIVSIIYGAASGGFIALFAVPLLGMGDIRELGTRMGLFLSVISIGALAGPPISGAINEATGGFVLVGVYAASLVANDAPYAGTVWA